MLFRLKGMFIILYLYWWEGAGIGLACDLPDRYEYFLQAGDLEIDLHPQRYKF